MAYRDMATQAVKVVLVALLSLPLFGVPQAPSQPSPPLAEPSTTRPTEDSSVQNQVSRGDSQPSEKKTNERDNREDGNKAGTSDGSASQTPANQAQTPIPQKDHPYVKQGSKADVDAIGNRGVGKGFNFYSLEHEIAMGKSLAQEVEGSSKLLHDPVVTEYVNRIGQNLVRNSDAKVPFTIKVIESDVVNAFALTGGFFYVDSGLILRADTEAEMAGVMAHEIAHVAARHGTKDATKSELAQLAMIPLIMLGPGGWAGYGLYQGLNFAIPMSFLKFSRQHEYEADYLGLEYMYAAGYDPNAFVSFFEKVETEEKRQPGTVP